MPTMSRLRIRLVRALALAWLLTGHAAYVPRERIGWGAANVTTVPTGVAVTLGVLSMTACVIALVTARVRLGGLVLAATIGCMTAASESYFANYRVFVAALAFVACVAPPDDGERALRVQCALVYVGAALDKVLDPAFRSGAVVRSLVTSVATDGAPYAPGNLIGLRGAWASALTGSHASVFAGLAWIVVGLELLLIGAHLRRSPWLPLVATTLHLGIYLITGSTFGVFFHACLAAAFVMGHDERLPSRRLHAPAFGYASSPFAVPEVLALGFAVGLAATLRRHLRARSSSGSNC